MSRKLRERHTEQTPHSAKVVAGTAAALLMIAAVVYGAIRADQSFGRPNPEKIARAALAERLSCPSSMRIVEIRVENLGDLWTCRLAFDAVNKFNAPVRHRAIVTGRRDVVERVAIRD
jgi:hypothetical protein